MNIPRPLLQLLNPIKGGQFQSYKHLFKKCSTSSQNTIECEEVKIPVPWGHIAAVHWGPKDKQPIVAFHGWQDNAGTWKTLIPHLNKDISVLAIDFPGHGKSSWYPPGILYNFSDNIIILRRIMKHFGWTSVSLLGHSMGAIASFVYASFYPNETKYVILLDNLKPITARAKNYIESSSKKLDKLIDVDNRNITGGDPPAYDFDTLVERFYLGAHKSVNKDKCPILLERGAQKSPSDPQKYYFSRDSRLKHSYNLGFDPNDVRALAIRLNMPILNLKFEQGPYFEPVENFNEIRDLIKEKNDKFEHYIVPGTHHSHLNNPQDIAPYINNFINKYS